MFARSRFITRSLGARTFSGTPIRADGKTIEASSETFDSLVTKAQQPVLVDFYATWCGPCKVLGPLLSKAVAENKQTRLIQIDVDQAIAALPTVAAFHKGQIVDQFVGMRDKAFLDKFVEKHGKRSSQ